MHHIVWLLLAFLVHLSTGLIITHQRIKHTLQKCVSDPWAWLGLAGGPHPHHRAESLAHSALIIVAICAMEDVIIPREFGGRCAILTTAAAIIAVLARFDIFLSGLLSVIINAAVIGLVSQSCASFAMRYAIRAIYAILLLCSMHYIANFYISKREIITCVHCADDIRDPNGIIATKVRAMW